MVRYWRHRSKEILRHVEPHIEKYFPFHKPELDRVSPSKALLTGKQVQVPFDMALGQVVPFEQRLVASHPNIIKVRLHKLCLNRFLLKTATYWAHDQGLKLRIGDIVLIEQTDQPIAFNTMYKVKKVAYPAGAIIDPVTDLSSTQGPRYSMEDLKTILDSIKLTNS